MEIFVIKIALSIKVIYFDINHKNYIKYILYIILFSYLKE